MDTFDYACLYMHVLLLWPPFQCDYAGGKDGGRPLSLQANRHQPLLKSKHYIFSLSELRAAPALVLLVYNGVSALHIHKHTVYNRTVIVVQRGGASGKVILRKKGPQANVSFYRSSDVTRYDEAATLQI